MSRFSNSLRILQSFNIAKPLSKQPAATFDVAEKFSPKYWHTVFRTGGRHYHQKKLRKTICNSDSPKHKLLYMSQSIRIYHSVMKVYHFKSPLRILRKIWKPSRLMNIKDSCWNYYEKIRIVYEKLWNLFLDIYI